MEITTMRHYFLWLAVFGLCLELMVALAIMRSSVFELMMESPVAILVGMVITLALGYFFDDGLLFSSDRFRLWLAAPVMFMGGVLLGCLVNVFMMKSHWVTPQEGFSNYFVKPVWWLNLIGLPMSLLVSHLFSWIWRSLGK